MNSSKRILILSAWLPGGGVETVISNLSKILTKRGYTIRVVSLSNIIEWSWYRSADIEISFYPIFRDPGAVNIAYTLHNFRKIKRIISGELDSYSPSNILVTHTVLGIFTSAYKRLEKAQLYFWPMNNLFRNPFEGKINSGIYSLFKRVYIKFLVERFAGALCISSQIYQELESMKMIQRYLTYVPIISKSTHSKNSRPINPHFIFVGRIDKRKNLSLILVALSQLPQRDWFFEVVGEGPEKANAVALAHSLGIQDNIMWMGLRFPAFGENCSYSALLMSSISEGFPVVVVDALLAGIPVVCPSTLSIYNDAIIEGKNGFGYEQGSVNSLTRAIIRAFKGVHMLESKEISASCKIKFGEEAFMQRLDDVFG
jgi:glycosyltransferase involved in cell wall biosynthesis